MRRTRATSILLTWGVAAAPDFPHRHPEPEAPIWSQHTISSTNQLSMRIGRVHRRGVWVHGTEPETREKWSKMMSKLPYDQQSERDEKRWWMTHSGADQRIGILVSASEHL